MIDLDLNTQGFATITIDNPPANALGRAARTALHGALDRVEAAASVRALILTGRGKCFCSGDDLKEQAAAQADGHDARRVLLDEFAALIARIAAIAKPTVAAINGPCLGGGLELALACDIRIASTAASFVCSGVNVGLLASAIRLPQLIGVARAKHLLLTGLPCDSETAERFGLVTALHAPEALGHEAERLAQRIASRAPLSVAATRALAEQANTLAPQDAAALTQQNLAYLVTTQDHAEALRAFAEKRTPHFTGA